MHGQQFKWKRNKENEVLHPRNIKDVIQRAYSISNDDFERAYTRATGGDPKKKVCISDVHTAHRAILVESMASSDFGAFHLAAFQSPSSLCPCCAVSLGANVPCICRKRPPRVQ